MYRCFFVIHITDYTMVIKYEFIVRLSRTQSKYQNQEEKKQRTTINNRDTGNILCVLLGLRHTKLSRIKLNDQIGSVML